jgi:hypothetical protein
MLGPKRNGRGDSIENLPKLRLTEMPAGFEIDSRTLFEAVKHWTR